MDQICPSASLPQRAHPELTMDVITLIVQHTQDLEHSQLVESMSTDRFFQESPSDMLARIRALLVKGLVSKLWQEAILNPSLWTTFLNASMHEDQFLRVISRAGDLPVAISFMAKSVPRISGDNVTYESTGYDRAIQAIFNKLPRVTKLLIDLSAITLRRARPITPSQAILEFMRYSMPLLHTLSVCTPERQKVDCSSFFGSGAAFGGVKPQIQHLQLSGITVAPHTFCNTLVSLSLWFTNVTRMRSELAPWLKHAEQGEIPGLRQLTIRALPGELNDQLRLASTTDGLAIPGTIKRVRIEGSILSVIYMATVLMHRIPATFEIVITYHPAHSGTMWILGTLFANLRGRIPSDELTLTVREDILSLAIGADKSATLAFVPSSPSVANHMLCAVASYWGDYLRVPDLYGFVEPSDTDTAWLKIDIVIHYHDLYCTHWDSRIPGPLESFSRLFQAFRDVRNVHVVQYVIEQDDSSELKDWEDSLRIFQAHRKWGRVILFPQNHPESSTQERSSLFPELKRLRVTEPPQGISREFQRAISAFTWDHLQSRIKGTQGASFENLEIIHHSNELSAVAYDRDLPGSWSHESWDKLCMFACGLD